MIGARAQALNVKPKDYSSEFTSAVKQIADQRTQKKKEDEAFDIELLKYSFVDAKKVHPKHAEEVQRGAQKIMSDFIKYKEESPYNAKSRIMSDALAFKMDMESRIIPSSNAMFDIADAEAKGFAVPQSYKKWSSNGLSNDLDFQGKEWEAMGVFWDPKSHAMQKFGGGKMGDLQKQIKTDLLQKGAYKVDALTGLPTSPVSSGKRWLNDKQFIDNTWVMSEQNVEATTAQALANPSLGNQLKTAFFLQAEQNPDYDWSNNEQMQSDLAAFSKNYIGQQARLNQPTETEEWRPGGASSAQGGLTPEQLEPKGQDEATLIYAFDRKESGGAKQQGTSVLKTRNIIGLGSASGGFTTMKANGAGGFNMFDYTPETGEVELKDPAMFEAGAMTEDFPIKMKIEGKLYTVATVKKGMPVPETITFTHSGFPGRGEIQIKTKDYIPASLIKETPFFAASGEGTNTVVTLENNYYGARTLFLNGTASQKALVPKIDAMYNKYFGNKAPAGQQQSRPKPAATPSASPSPTPAKAGISRDAYMKLAPGPKGDYELQTSADGTKIYVKR